MRFSTIKGEGGWAQAFLGCEAGNNHGADAPVPFIPQNGP